MPDRAATEVSTRFVPTVLALCLATFVVMTDTTVVQVMLPTLMRELGAGLDQALWVVNAFVLAYGALLIPGARIGDMLGFRKVLVAGLLVFLVGSVLCGVVGSVPLLVASRCVQAVGGALLVPQTLGLITVAVPAHRRGTAFGMVGATMALAAIVGPVLGGLLVAELGWRSAFLVNVPLCLGALALVRRFVPERAPSRRHRLDLGGVVLIAASVGMITYALLTAGRYDTDAAVPVLFGAGLLLFAGFVRWEQHRREPLVPGALLRHRSFTVSAALAAAQFAVMFGMMLLVTLHLQGTLGSGPVRTGLVFLPMAVVSGVVSPLAGHLTDRWGGRRIITAGFVAFAVSLGWLAVVGDATAGALDFLGPLAIAGLAVGLVMAPVSTEAMRGLPEHLLGAGAGVLNTGRQLAGAVGVALVGGALQLAAAVRQSMPEPGSGRSGLDGVASFAGSPRGALLVLAVIVAGSLAGARLLPGRAAAVTASSARRAVRTAASEDG
ncbi:DHA2 family efflux MFS transporter permease subunit [Micromonospora sp. NPDC000442]|uniref:DHA2 family efflux MFS transporter permease subunit n=1 Tax=Micromonospora sp. NPDC000442 TaxID=3364217 RepID=UPI0036ACAA8D